MAEPIDVLLTDAGRRAFDAELAALVRVGRHEAAEAILTRLLAAVGSEHAAVCLALPAEAVTLEGWDAFNVRIAAMAARGRPATAVGIDITEQGDAVDAQGRREQQLETSYYDASGGFDFAAAGRAGVLAASEGMTTAPWVGDFADIDGTLSARGLAPLYDLLLQRPMRHWAHVGTEEERRHNLGAYLAAWFRHLRVHQAVRRALEAGGLAADIPVMVGTNETPPYFTAVYWPSRVRDEQAAAAELVEAEAAGNRAAYDAQTEWQIERWREQRQAIRTWTPSVNPDKRRQYIELVEAMDAGVRRGTPLEAFQAGHALSDREFERMVQTWRHHRDPSAPAPAAADTRRRGVVRLRAPRRVVASPTPLSNDVIDRQAGSGSC